MRDPRRVILSQVSELGNYDASKISAKALLFSKIVVT
jgi:hypothetical protein